MNKFIMLFVLTMMVGCVQVYAGVERTLSGYFDTDDCLDDLTYRYDPDVIGEMEASAAEIEIKLHCAGNSSRKMKRLYNMSSSHLSVLAGKPGEIVIFEAEDIATQDKSYRHYQYNESANDWYLTKLVDVSVVTSYDPPLRYRTYGFKYYSGVRSLDDKIIDENIACVESDSERNERMNDVLASWHNNLMSLYNAKKFETLSEHTLDQEQVAELMHNVPVSTKNVEVYNNIGFILSYDNDEINLLVARYILEQVVNNVPSRTPAYLNLADVYESLGLRNYAIPLYRKYVELMEKEGKEKRIPSRVVNKVKQE